MLILSIYIYIYIYINYMQNNDNDQQNDTSSNVYTSSNLSGSSEGLDNLELDNDVSDFSEVLESDHDVSERNAEQDYRANRDADQVNNIYL